MNILIINHYAGSPDMGMEFRPYFMAQEWKKMGHKVTIIAASYAHVRTVQKYFKKTIQKEIINGIDYIWIKTPKYEGNGIGRIKNIFSFIWHLNLRVKKFTKELNPDVVIASSTYPFDIFPAKKIARLNNAKLIFEVHDLWPLSPIELGGMSRNHPFIRAVQFVEDFAYKHCDLVISMLPKTKEHMISRGLNPSKFNYIPNGINLDDWTDKQEIPNEHDTLINNLRNAGKKLVCYAGSYGIANSLDTLINTAQLLQNENIAIILVGKGPEKLNFIKIVKKENINNVYFLPPVKKQQIPDLLDKMDILYIGLQRQSLFRFGISPNKMFDYMMAGKPIIQSIEAGNNIVKDANCGLSVEPENPKETKNTILKLLSHSEEELKQIGLNGKNYVLKNHEYAVLAKKFIDIIK